MAEGSRSRGILGSVRRWLGGRRAAVPRVPAQLAEPASAGPVEVDPRIGVMLAEWQDIGASLRHADDRQLARLAVFVTVSGAIVGGYLGIAAAPARGLDLARWTLPALGILVGLVFLALQLGSLAHRQALVRRGRQIETAMQILVPGIGHVKSLALISELLAEERGWVRAAAAAVGALYGVLLLAWVAALVATAVGWLPGRQLP